MNETLQTSWFKILILIGGGVAGGFAARQRSRQYQDQQQP